MLQNIENLSGKQQYNFSDYEYGYSFRKFTLWIEAGEGCITLYNHSQQDGIDCFIPVTQQLSAWNNQQKGPCQYEVFQNGANNDNGRHQNSHQSSYYGTQKKFSSDCRAHVHIRKIKQTDNDHESTKYLALTIEDHNRMLALLRSNNLISKQEESWAKGNFLEMLRDDPEEESFYYSNNQAVQDSSFDCGKDNYTKICQRIDAKSEKGNNTILKPSTAAPTTHGNQQRNTPVSMFKTNPVKGGGNTNHATQSVAVSMLDDLINTLSLH